MEVGRLWSSSGSQRRLAPEAGSEGPDLRSSAMSWWEASSAADKAVRPFWRRKWGRKKNSFLSKPAAGTAGVLRVAVLQ